MTVRAHATRPKQALLDRYLVQVLFLLGVVVAALVIALCCASIYRVANPVPPVVKICYTKAACQPPKHLP